MTSVALNTAPKLNYQYNGGYHDHSPTDYLCHP